MKMGIREMKKLTGTEKQVAWAEDIRARYQKTLATLRAAVEVYRDLTQVEEVDHDPILGDETRLVYTRTLTPAQQGAIATATRWAPGYDRDRPGKAGSWVIDRERALIAAGADHTNRRAVGDRIEATADNLEAALNTETDAKYWIDRR